MREWTRTKRQRAHEAARGVDFWFRQHYQLPPSDPRYLDTTALQRLDEFYTHQAYQRMIKGESTTESYQTDLDEEGLLSELDDLDGDAWEDIPAMPEDIMSEIDRL